ncbi:DNA-3-methyladenine glycosylase 2 family protein [Dactylosporangium siamense]|uniref:DNA-3-methyladenine glycosylase 2 family protein n=2 Tax=Dactylosporangium siamense TaxID=685454 RepID=A0A919PZW2_9ACTN|nr:DNA-3-methyladenine glycosylase 2 family protein [Dactylosporangium siamense]
MSYPCSKIWGMTELGTTTATVLRATAPFNFACSLRAMESFAPCSGDQLVVDGRVRRAFLHPTDPTRAVVAEVVGRDDGVAVTVFSDDALTPAETATVGDRVSDWLSLRDDRDTFLGLARADPAMAPILAVAEGLHQVRFASLTEGAVFYTLVHHSKHWFATARKRRLLAAHGPHGVVDGVVYAAFPPMSTLVALGVAGLKPYASNMLSARRLHTVLTGLSALDEHWLRTGPAEEVYAALLSVRGVGPFTAHALLLRVLGHPDRAPLELQQHLKAATSIYGAPPPSPAELREWYRETVGWWAYTARTGLDWIEREQRAVARAAAAAVRAG